MAHAARVSELADGLIQSTTSIGKDGPRHRQLKSAVTRGLRDQSHARTNQFEVGSRLDGLVEKFLVLNRDDLADALQTRLEELPTGNKWLPEMLALCLALSDRPAEKTPEDALERLIVPLPVEETLSWDDIVAEDPLNEPGVWDDIEHGYHSSDDEALSEDAEVSEHTFSTTATSVGDDLEALAALHMKQPDDEVLREVEATRSAVETATASQPLPLHELVLVRESLAMLRGSNTDLYQSDAATRKASLHLSPIIRDAAPSTVRSALARFARIGSGVQALRRWTRSQQKRPYMRTLQASTEQLLSTFAGEMSSLDDGYVCHSADTVVSVVMCLTHAENAARHVLALAGLAQHDASSGTKSTFSLLDAIYEHIISAQMAGDDESTQVLGTVLCEATKTYLRTASDWVLHGTVNPENDDFLVQESGQGCSLGEIWHARYAIRRDRSGQPSAPAFIQGLAPRIFSLGKTRMFMNRLSHNGTDHGGAADFGLIAPGFKSMMRQLRDSPFLPFSQALDDTLQEWLSKISTDSAPQLKRSIFHDQGLSNSLRDLNAVFLSGNGAQFQLFAEPLFARMGGGSRRWANAFLLTELARDAFGSIMPAHNITVSLDANEVSNRTTVEALQALHIQYHFTWPIQNVTREQSAGTYARAFTLLLQITRARHLLRDQLFHVRPRSSLKRPDPCRSLVQLRQKLLAYTLLLQTHAATVGRVLSAEAHEQMSAAGDLDAMVGVYAAYKQRLELSLLLATNLKPVHDAVISLLVVCERFVPVWDAAIAAEEEEAVVKEAPMSARALQKETDGLTSFITAGVRSVSRAGAEPLLVMLAEQLEWLAD